MLNEYITFIDTNRLGYSPIKCLDNGRWALTPEFDLYDAETNNLYVRDRAIPLATMRR